MISTQDLRNKEVINIHNGKSLGFVEDIAVDLERGIVEGIVIPQQSTGLFSFFGKGGEIIIPWNLAYGEQGQPQGGIPPFSTLIFKVTLVEIK